MDVTTQAARTFPIGRKLGQDAALFQELQRWLRIFRQQLTCMVIGHEKWQVPSGDWVCMSCGQVKHTECPIYPHDAEENRRQLHAVRESLTAGLEANLST